MFTQNTYKPRNPIYNTGSIQPLYLYSGYYWFSDGAVAVWDEGGTLKCSVLSAGTNQAGWSQPVSLSTNSNGAGWDVYYEVQPDIPPFNWGYNNQLTSQQAGIWKQVGPGSSYVHNSTLGAVRNVSSSNTCSFVGVYTTSNVAASEPGWFRIVIRDRLSG